ncbi:hypothetical protein Y032_0603g527 [Ancylostoma ceylanicum]|uniref:Uncharacterized protein n=1 Tax=Ancylostoma ceylanicum TaxID=53326 RepID=A0A016WN12_9BILA|nr:hypothetical protein Y032_0603g527 [Ancylostoma ceylanicum]
MSCLYYFLLRLAEIVSLLVIPIGRFYRRCGLEWATRRLSHVVDVGAASTSCKKKYKHRYKQPFWWA